ncbi:MAG: hypothetical protein ACRCX4_08075 [Bacteroidales bacterium]
MKRILYLTATIVISVLMLFSCQADNLDNLQSNDEIIELENGKLIVPLGLELPVYTSVQTKSAGDEAVLKNVRVVVYDLNNLIIQCVEGKPDPANNQRVEAVLQRYSGKCSLQVFANIPDRFLSEFRTGNSFGRLSELKLTTEDLVLNIAGGIPVNSDSKMFDRLDPSSLSGITIPLKYVYARIDIQCNANGYTLSECTLINGAAQSSFIENTVKADLGGEEIRQKISVTGNQVTNIYLFENNEISGSSQDKNTTDLIVKINQGFYRICITHTDESGKDVYSIRRGYKYNVVINAVKGSGYMTFDEAKNNKPANILYDITVDDGRSKDIITSNGAYYLGVTNSEFYLYADVAKGVVATYLSHNAPATVTNATISVTGAGITLPATEGLTLQSPTKATLNLRNGTLQNFPLKINMDESSSSGLLTIRIGDLEKTIKIQRRNNQLVDGTYSIPASDFQGADFKSSVSFSERLKFDAGKNLVMDNKPAYSDRNRVISYATAFAGDVRKNVLIAVKRPAQEVVYYEKYADGSYGFCYQNADVSTLYMNNEKEIVESGYGVINLSTNASGQVRFRDASFTSNAVTALPLWADYSGGAFYPVNQTELSKRTFDTYYAELITFGTKSTQQYVFPYLAKGVYGTSTVTDGIGASPLKVRTPLQFRQITRIYGYLSKNYLQEYDLDFSKAKIGGISGNISSALIYGEFLGAYDGGNNLIKNITFYDQAGTYLSLFEVNKGTLQNLHLSNINITASSSGCLTGLNYGTIQQIFVENCRLYSYYTYLGFIAGHNYEGGYIYNCLVIGDSRYNFAIYNYSQYTGAIVGCNHTYSRGIKNVCVVDLNPSPSESTVPIVHSNSIDYFAGGIVGKNNSYMENALFIGKIPTGEKKYPVAGVNDVNGRMTNCYYLDIPVVMPPGVGQPPVGGGGKGFKTKNAASLVLDDNWIIEGPYPYPRLRSFPSPASWPVAN